MSNKEPNNKIQDVKEQRKTYYNLHKKHILDGMMKPVYCIYCEKSISKCYLNKHQRTKRHKTKVEEQKIKEQNLKEKNKTISIEEYNEMKNKINRLNNLEQDLKKYLKNF